MAEKLDMIRTYLDGRIMLTKFRGVRRVMAADSSGDRCECILIPIDKNGLFVSKTGNIQIKFHGTVKNAKDGIFSEYVLTPRIGTLSAEKMEKLGVISTTHTRQWGMEIGRANLVLPIGSHFNYIKNKVGDLKDPDNPYVRFNTYGMKKTRDEHGNPIEGADRSRSMAHVKPDKRT